MIYTKALRSQRFSFPYIKPHANSNLDPATAALSQSLSSSTKNQRSMSTSAASEERGEEAGDASAKIDCSNAKPYDVMFKEAVGLIERTGDSEGESAARGGEIGKNLLELEAELRLLTSKSDGTDGNLEWRPRKWWRRKQIGTQARDSWDVVSSASSVDLGGESRALENKSRPPSLSALFGRGSGSGRKGRVLDGREGLLGNVRIPREREDLIVKELSSDIKALIRHLYDQGYFKDVNFLPGNNFDLSSFESPYALNYLKFAAESFGRDKQEIAKWLSGSDLKEVALSGCPSTAKRNVFAAKSLRTFFQIPEDTVCRKCVLRESCKFVNQSIWNKNTKNLHLSPVMRLLTVYGLQASPANLVLSDDIKACVSRLTKDVINLSKTVP